MFKTDDATIDLEQVTALEEATPGGTAAQTPALNVLLRDGSSVPVRGEDEVQEFVGALDAHLEPDGEG